MSENKEKSLIEQPIDVSAEKELQIAPSTAMAIQEIQGAIIIAKKFPRKMDECWSKLMKACQRKTFADKARYTYPRGKGDKKVIISGPSVNLARTAGQCYGNVRWSLDVLRDDDEYRTIKGWAWDMENNVYVAFEDHFQKLIFRRDGGWIVPDERELRELTNRRGAILVRNALLGVMPRDFIEDAEGMCVKTLKENIKDPAGEKKRLILAFEKIGVPVKLLTEYLGTSSWSPDDLIELQGILTAISEGHGKREDYFLKEQEPPANGTIKNMKAGDASKHQGYDVKPSKAGEKEGF